MQAFTLDKMPELESVKDVKWADESKTEVIATVKLSHLDFEIPLRAGPNYDMPYGVEMFEKAVAGEYGTVGDYVAPAPIPVETQRAQARSLAAVEIRQKLSALGHKRSVINKTIDDIKDEDKQDDITDYWEYTTEYYRLDENLIELLDLLGLSEAGMDALFGIE